ncbi:glycerate kinase [Aurantibacter crassamenti]|uniref:glycerate kinase n=1 Tax=Aurantibacter crassamenti TaxID=1837375 RepID=UPI0019397383|nr:glycerate kinase [Aurantibacter crassamenti]MBM1107508.1 glycerate kinase [Aurantibacter crassamenti]
MKFIIAPDKFKGSLSGFEFCDAVAEGLQKVSSDFEIVKIPLADGGDGTIDVVNHYLNGNKISLEVNSPFFRPIQAHYLYADQRKIAFIEMAEASGLKLLQPSEFNCINATTYGTGQLIADALDKGAKEIILGIGGSATNDGGMGMANALGFRFLDENDKELQPIGNNLNLVARIDDTNKHHRLNEVKIKVACDVSNPFYGENGAAHVYAKQKGANDKEIKELDSGLQYFAKVITEKYNINLQTISGAGAAGGIGGGAVVFLNGQLTSGIELIKELADFDHKISDADWIITGEGMIDMQTLAGKTISGVITSAAKKNIPVAAFCGSVNLSLEEQKKLNLTYVTSIVQGISNLQEAMDSSYENLVKASYNFASLLKNKS